MNNVRNLLIGLCLAAASVGAMAQNTDEHSTHHPAMTMGFSATEQQLKGLKVGDKVSFDFRMNGGTATIVGIRKQ